MLEFTIDLDGDKKAAKTLLECVTEFDSSYAKHKPSTFMELEVYCRPLDDVDEVESLAISIAERMPDNDFRIEGIVIDKNGERIRYLYEYKKRRLFARTSGWYTIHNTEGFKTYEDCCEYYQHDDGTPIFTKEEYETYKTELFCVMDNSGECVKTASLSPAYEIDLERQKNCPICGEALYQGVPVALGEDDVCYHIWCAEGAGKKINKII